MISISPTSCLYGTHDPLWVSVHPLEYFPEKKHLPDNTCKLNEHDHQLADLVMAWLP